MFWVVIYCLHINRCYISQDIPGGPHRYPTAESCSAAIPGKEIHKNSQCVGVRDVSCYNGGSACTFTPVDLAGVEALKNMVQPPK